MFRTMIYLISFLLVSVLVSSASAALPAGWQSRDIGTTGGSAAEIDGIWAVSGNGDDIWYKSDQFHFAYTRLSGDCTIVARVVDNGTGLDNWAKGGVMIRETLNQNSKYAMMAITGGDGGGKAFQHRQIAGQPAMSAHGGYQVSPPMWVKLTRIGDTFTGYYSINGFDWIEQENWSLDGNDAAKNPANIEMARDVFIGLFVTSHKSGEIRTYTFENVSVVDFTAPGDLVDVTSPGDLVQGVPNDGDWPHTYRLEIPDMAIDNNIETKYLHFKGDFEPDPGTDGTGFRVTPWIGPTIVTGLTLTTANDFPGRDPIAFELSGSNVGINGPYEFIASGYIIDFAQWLAWPRFTMNIAPITFENHKEYAHYQLLFTAIRGPAGGPVNSMQIAEVELLGAPAPAPVSANIILVTEEIDKDWDGLRDDHSLESFLISEGHTVDVRPEYWNVLTPDKIAQLNAADLIIVSRLAWSSRYHQDNEAADWNSLTTPLLLMNSHFARNIRWKWVNSEAREPDDNSYIYAGAVDQHHPIFRGVLTPKDLAAPNGPLGVVEMIDPLVGTGFTAFIDGIDMGNGWLIAKPVGLEAGWIVEWNIGTEFFDGAGQYAGGKRMLFCAGTREIRYYDNDRKVEITTVQGELNLTAEGLQMFRNAIDYLLGREITERVFESAVEDFETNDFSRLPWSSYGDVSWETTRSERHSGHFSARSGSIEDGEETTLEVSLDCDSGYITFYCKVSCESGYDELTFYIDGLEQGKWSGQEDWAEVSFYVREGTRTFKWAYSKDSSISAGEDTAWIDDIIFPIGP